MLHLTLLTQLIVRQWNSPNWSTKIDIPISLPFAHHIYSHSNDIYPGVLVKEESYSVRAILRLVSSFLLWSMFVMTSASGQTLNYLLWAVFSTLGHWCLTCISVLICFLECPFPRKEYISWVHFVSGGEQGLTDLCTSTKGILMGHVSALPWIHHNCIVIKSCFPQPMHKLPLTSFLVLMGAKQDWTSWMWDQLQYEYLHKHSCVFYIFAEADF